MRMNRKSLIAVLLICLFATVGTTFAYFTDYEQAVGGKPVYSGSDTTIEEGNDSKDKDIVITNTGDTEDTPVITRVSIIGETEEGVTVTAEDNWVKGKDGFYYYTKALKPGESTKDSKLYVEVKTNDKDKAKDFDIIVNHESAQLVLDENGNVKMPSGWDSSVKVSFEE